MNFKTLLIFLALLPLSCIAGSANSALRIIELQNRPAAEVQTLIEPMLAPEDRVIANGFQLLIKTSPQRYQEIEQLVRQLDAKLQNLLITVIQSQTLSAEQLNAGVNVNIHSSNSGVNTTINPHLNAQSKQQQRQFNQRIRTMEGQPAYIESGQVRNVTTSTYPNPGAYQRTQTLLQAGTGFEVTPRLNGAEVILDVRPWSNHFESNRKIKTQGLQTTITTRLGIWVELGSSAQQSNQDRQGLFSKGRQSGSETTKTFIKVDKI